ncbi:MAG TPA: hypothetical protein VEQ60_31295, partial [Longimicrobium sp.]|nr:hypothetical protein [Longimicrobium sp.]
WLTQALLDAVYPSRLFLINGIRPDRLSWREGATAWIHEQLRKEWFADNPVVERQGDHGTLPSRRTSTLDYRETVSTLLELYWELAANHRILLAPTGSKMQAVGCFFTKAMHPDIHVEYPTPSSFFSLYSQGISDLWITDFGPLKDLVSQLAETDRDLHLGLGAH